MATSPLQRIPLVPRRWRPLLSAAALIGHGLLVLCLAWAVWAWRQSPDELPVVPLGMLAGGLMAGGSAIFRRRIGLAAARRGDLLNLLPGEPVVGVDARGRVTFGSLRFGELLGDLEQTYIGRPMVELLQPEVGGEPAPDLTAWWQHEGHLSFEIGGRRFAVEADVNVLTRPLTRTEFLVSFRDDTLRRNYEQRMERLALTDPLTGLANRHSLDDHLRAGLARLERAPRLLGVLYADLDRFKAVNDSLGHDVGDKLLVEVANRIREQVRGGDIVGRIGGDEFVVLCPELEGAEQATVIAERIIEAVSAPIRIDEHEVAVGISVGIRLTDSAHTKPSELLRDADAALYASKSLGGQATTFDDSLARSVGDRFELESDLRIAIRAGEIDVHFQPHVTLKTGEVTGFEALARWTHATKGNITPDRFIPVAEETGMIADLGALVLIRSMDQLALWHAERPDLRLQMSVNVSALQLRDRNFVPLVAGVLHDTGLEPSQLVLELTESVLLDTVQGGDEALRRLDALGVRLAVDDFGTGYSSLALLRTLPIDIVKIDRAFVTPMPKDAKHKKLVGAIIAMTHALGKEAIAEGVENEDERGILDSLGCDRYQGYLHTRPSPASQLAHLITSAPDSRTTPGGTDRRPQTANA